MTAHLKPTFFIIGERKCGTSSLFRYLVAHPLVLPGRLKEPNFFAGRDLTSAQTEFGAYLSNFPELDSRQSQELVWPELNEQGVLFEEKVRFELLGPKQQIITGEASANTLAEADPEVVRALLPGLKLIVVMRDPAERAFSHYRMLERFRDEGRQLSMPVRDLMTDLKREINRVEQGLYSELISPGLYAQNLRNWLRFFPSSQFLFLFSEELNQPENRQSLLNRVLQYLDLPPHDYGTFLTRKFNVAPGATLPKEARKLLRTFYAEADQELADLLDQELPWDASV